MIVGIAASTFHLTRDLIASKDGSSFAPADKEPRQSSLVYLFRFFNDLLLLSRVVRIRSLFATVGLSSTLHNRSDFPELDPLRGVYIVLFCDLIKAWYGLHHDS